MKHTLPESILATEDARQKAEAKQIAEAIELKKSKELACFAKALRIVFDRVKALTIDESLALLGITLGQSFGEMIAAMGPRAEIHPNEDDPDDRGIVFLRLVGVSRDLTLTVDNRYSAGTVELVHYTFTREGIDLKNPEMREEACRLIVKYALTEDPEESEEE